MMRSNDTDDRFRMIWLINGSSDAQAGRIIACTHCRSRSLTHYFFHPLPMLCRPCSIGAGAILCYATLLEGPNQQSANWKNEQPEMEFGHHCAINTHYIGFCSVLTAGLCLKKIFTEPPNGGSIIFLQPPPKVSVDREEGKTPNDFRDTHQGPPWPMCGCHASHLIFVQTAIWRFIRFSFQCHTT